MHPRFRHAKTALWILGLLTLGAPPAVHAATYFRTSPGGALGGSGSGSATPGPDANAPPAIVLDAASASRAVAGSSYTVQATLSGATATDWARTSGPAWLGVTRGGLLSGTPPIGTTSFSYVLTAVQASGMTTQLPVDVMVSPPTNAIGLTLASDGYSFHVGKAGSIMPTVLSGSGTRSWKFSGAKPAPLSIDPASGRITSAASASTLGPVHVDVTVTDATGSATAGFTYSIVPTLGLAYQSQVFFLGKPASAQPSTTAFPGSTYAASDGRLNSGFHGVVLDPMTGALKGTPSSLMTGRQTNVTVSEPDGTALASANFVYVVQPTTTSYQLSSGASLYGGGSDIAQVLGLEQDGKGVSLPPGGSVTQSYDATYTLTSVNLSAGSGGAKVRIDYQEPGGAWKQSMWNGTFLLPDGSSSGTNLSSGASIAAIAIRATNTGTTTGQLDRLVVQ